VRLLGFVGPLMVDLICSSVRAARVASLGKRCLTASVRASSTAWIEDCSRAEIVEGVSGALLALAIALVRAAWINEGSF